MAWEKLVVNAELNAQAALLRVRNGALLDSPSCTRLMRGEFPTPGSAHPPPQGPRALFRPPPASQSLQLLEMEVGQDGREGGRGEGGG